MKLSKIAGGEAFKLDRIEAGANLTQDEVTKVSAQKHALADEIAEWLGIPPREVWFAGDDVYMHIDHENRLLPETIGRPENNGTLKASPGQYIVRSKSGEISVRTEL